MKQLNNSKNTLELKTKHVLTCSSHNSPLKEKHFCLVVSSAKTIRPNILWSLKKLRQLANLKRNYWPVLQLTPFSPTSTGKKRTFRKAKVRHFICGVTMATPRYVETSCQQPKDMLVPAAVRLHIAACKPVAK
jgi:hypothetical protein